MNTEKYAEAIMTAMVTITLAFSGLTVNQGYLVQLWAVDMRAGPDRTQTVTLDGGTPSGTMHYYVPGGGVSSYVIGRFTANATTASFVIDGDSKAFNAIQLRAITGPPPADYAAWAAAQDPPVTGGPDYVGPDGI